jgi:hypothetical protein
VNQLVSRLRDALAIGTSDSRISSVIAQDLLAWTRLLCLEGALSRRAETAPLLPLARGWHHRAIRSAQRASTRRDLAMAERACDRVRPRQGDPACLLKKSICGRRRPQTIPAGTTQRIHVPLTSCAPASITCCPADLDGP